MSAVTWTVGCVEDDASQAELLRLWLEHAGYGCAVFKTANDFRRRLGNEAVDLVLLDRSLPDATGLEVLEWIRQSPNASLPVIFLTASGEESDIVEGLAAGGDDYVVKPPKQAELLARVAAVLRRRGGADTDGTEVLDLPPYRIDQQRRQISVDGEPVELTQREYELACYLFRRQGRIVSRDALLENVWNLAGDVTTRTVDTHISRLRKKLNLTGENGWRLTAVYQHGYRVEQG
ncbi:MAG: response regulator transcription factor [Proteobacteria bacterium]|nr:response regulator transcription factor [Pseudomonadota bacterium]